MKSTIKFYREGVGTESKVVFDKWNAILVYTSNHVEDGVLDVKIQAADVNTGSGLKDGKLKSKDFFDVEQNPYITFHCMDCKPIELGLTEGSQEITYKR